MNRLRSVWHRAPLVASGFLIATLFAIPLVTARAENPPVFKDQQGLNTLVDPSFVPPSLDELNAKAKWVKQPVRNGMQAYREYAAKLAPVSAEAKSLSLKNDSLESNAKLRIALGAPASDSQPANYDAILNRRIKGEVNSTNPLMINSTEEFDLSGLLSFGLFGFDWEMQPFASADAVVSWESSADGMYDKVVLRDDLLWSDGQPITAEDVAFSFRVIMNPDVDIPAVRSQTNELKLVHAYDPRTVVFFHKQPLVTNVWNVNFPIIPRHVYEKSWPDDVKLVNSPAHRKLEDQPITGGPYEIESRKAQQEIVLKRRENYYLVNGRQVREKPYFKQIRFRIVTDPNTALLSLQRGDIEELELSMQHWQTRTGGNDFYARNTKARAPEWTYFYFGWNNRHPIFQDPAVRQAMGFAFDHQEMLTTQNFGLTQPSVGMFHPESWMFPKTPDKPREQDLDRALDLLADAGWEDTDNDGILDKEIDGKQKKFEFIMLCLNDPNRIEHCALLKNNLEKLGILCTVRPMELAALIEKMRKRDFEAYFGGWGTGTDPDTSENLWTTSAIEDGRNYVGYSNPAVDGLYLLGKQLQTNTAIREKICRDYGLAKVGITPAATRAEIYAKIHEVLYADQPVTFLYFRSSFYGFNKDLRGIHFSPRGPYHYSPGFSAIHKPSLR